jgi:hypothetical protein
LNIIFIHESLIIQIFLQAHIVMQGSRKQKQLFSMLQSVVADSLEKGFSFRNEGVVVQVISDSAVARENLLLG